MLYNWKWQRNAPADVLNETMHEDNSGFGVWNRVDTGIELCVAVGYPLFSVLCHVRVRSKERPASAYHPLDMNTLPVTYYQKSEYIETVVYLSFSCTNGSTYALGHGKQGLKASYNCRATKHHPRWQDCHRKWRYYSRRLAKDRPGPCCSHLGRPLLSHRRRLHNEVRPLSTTLC